MAVRRTEGTGSCRRRREESLAVKLSRRLLQYWGHELALPREDRLNLGLYKGVGSIVSFCEWKVYETKADFGILVSSEAPILLVEDEPDDQFFIVEAFRTNKVMVPIHVLNSASAAIAYLHGEGQYADRTKFALPRLIITDLKMAGGSGFTLLEYLKQDRQWASIPKIVLSASGDREDIQTAYPLGANCYHKKPSSFAELCKLMKRLYDYWGIASDRK